jgi:two-component system, OmpR family, phosphate regulon sensor histidine kinase PhoR
VSSAEEVPQDIGAQHAPAGDELDLLRRRLVNVLGHALRTPMATVRGQAEILAHADDPEVRAGAVEPLLRSARRLEEMIDELLVVEGVETRLPTGTAEEIDLAGLLRALADEAGAGDRLELHGATSATVLAPRDALGWALRGVVDNAARYGRGPIRVDVAVGDEGAVTLRVATPEGGIPTTEDDLRLAFEPFFRGERAVVAATSRLGVGLTITRRLLEDLGGSARLLRDEAGVVALVELPRP